MSRIPRTTPAPTSRSPMTRSSRGARTKKVPAQRLCDPQRGLEHYLIWHEAEGHSRKTELVYRKTLRPFFAYLKDEQQIEDLGDLTLEHLRAWLVWLRNTPGPHDRPRSSKTIESYCRQVKAFLHWLYVEELLDHNPAERLKLPKAEKKHLRVFTSGQSPGDSLFRARACLAERRLVEALSALEEAGRCDASDSEPARLEGIYAHELATCEQLAAVKL